MQIVSEANQSSPSRHVKAAPRLAPLPAASQRAEMVGWMLAILAPKLVAQALN